jgi:hypothetical protein
MRYLLICATVACGATEPGEPGESIVAFTNGDCEDINCPGNSNVVGGIGPYEMAMSGRPSSRGFSFDRNALTKRSTVPNVPAAKLRDFAVVGGRLQATVAATNTPIWGPSMEGLQIPIHFADGVHPAADYVMLLERWEEVRYYDGLTFPPLDGYYIRYRKIDGDAVPDPTNGSIGWKDLCPYVEYDANSFQGRTWAMFWKGDRYDPVTGQIIASDDAVGDWFNIGCAGDASVKMVRAKASGVTAPGIARHLKQATLNMFTAKYCPRQPDRFTHVGVRIAWDDLTEPHAIGTVGTMEAVWNEFGAVCLTTQRSTEDGDADCGLTECSRDQIENWQDHGDLRSGNPFFILAQPPPEPKLVDG